MKTSRTMLDHPINEAREGKRPSQPVLIVNLKSGNGRAEDIDLIATARELGLETLAMKPGDDLANLGNTLVNQGCDHLMMAGGDGSLAIVAEVAMTRDVPFSCVPVGTRNHFAMDLGLDRRHPLRSLDAAFDGLERSIDVGLVAGRVFLNNVSFGLYAQAIADPDYRSHRARSMADAAVDTASHLEAEITLSFPDGRVVDDIEVLVASNNPYRFIGPPDFAARPALDTGTLGIILGDRGSRLRPGPAVLTRWEDPMIIVHSKSPEIQAGVDGELRMFQSPIEVAILPQSLRVLVPRETQPRTLKESIGQLNERAVVHLSGLPLPRRSELEAKSPLLRRLHEIDAAIFERVVAWESPALDGIMPALSQAASHSKIWMAVAMVMSLAGGRKGRRTAVEGLVAVGITSFLANLVAKSLFRRQRPTEDVPEERRLPLPASSSMPSGHTASGAAFSAVVGAAYPGLRAPLNALAATIGFSRIYTGVHYPADVLAGWLLGKGVGSLALSVMTRLVRRARITGRAKLGLRS